jgi:hypothetical protein
MLRTTVAILAGLLFAVTVGIASQASPLVMVLVAMLGFVLLKALARYLSA